MSKIFTEIFVAILVIFLAVWTAISSSTLPEYMQWYILITISVVGALLFIFPKISFDFKIICMLILGYAFAGKGFAYLTPYEPFYIGEIVWTICLFGYISRIFKGSPILPTWMHIMILLWMVTIGLYLVYGYKEFGIVAIRDSAIGYYAMFAFYGYTIFNRNDLARSFGYVLKASVLFACLAHLMQLSGVNAKLISLNAVIGTYFNPHPDAYLPLVAAGGMYCLVEGIGRKSMLRILAGIAMLLLLFTSKTAGIFSFIILLAYMIAIARRTDLILTSSIAIAMAALGVGVLFSIDSVKFDEWIAHNEHLETFSVNETPVGKSSSTTDWRLAWWTIIYQDTMAESPVFGTGLGSDISGHFLQSYYRTDLTSEFAKSYARYPHNMLLTVFGRLGFVGIVVFLALMILIARMHIKATRLQRNDTSDDGKTMLLAQLIVIAGMANAFVQATYEVPYAAITNWFCFGYVIAYWTKQIRNRSQYVPKHHLQIPNQGLHSVNSSLKSL